MILVDAIYINNSGGKVLLDYLIEKIEENTIPAHFLLDERIQNNHPTINRNKVTYLPSSLTKRHTFYKQHQNSFVKVLCFGNLPPSIRLKATVFTYFHQELFLKIPNILSIKLRLIFRIKAQIFKQLKNNTDYWIVQTKGMQQRLYEGLGKTDITNILIVPFYPPLKNTIKNVNNSGSLLYVSSGSEHKNHYNLLHGFMEYYDNARIGELHLTVGSESRALYNYIEEKCKKGYPIINHGFVPRQQIAQLYSACKYVIYPSLSESFGLSIVEGIECGCDVIGADVPYMYEVCEPSITFDPLMPSDISRAIEESNGENVPKTTQKIFNQIEDLLSLLKENQ